MVYRPTARVLTVLELLQSHGRMTGTELARRLEVDVRTVRHYIETLQDLGIPVEAERGRYGAYHLRPGFKLPPLIFTEDEALALTLSLLVARGHGLATATPAFAGVLAKVERVLPETTRARVQAVQQTVAFEYRPARSTPQFAVVATLSEAVQAGRRVRLHYRSARADATERDFDPYGVACHAGVWYAVGHCHLRREQRLFRLDRIAQIAVTDETFSRPTDFDALAAVRRALASMPNVWQVAVWIETTLEVLQWRTGSTSAYFKEVDGGVLLHGEVEDLRWIAVMLAGLGVPFVIRAPPELRVALREYALALVREAERTET